MVKKKFPATLNTFPFSNIHNSFYIPSTWRTINEHNCMMIIFVIKRSSCDLVKDICGNGKSLKLHVKNASLILGGIKTSVVSWEEETSYFLQNTNSF